MKTAHFSHQRIAPPLRRCFSQCLRSKAGALAPTQRRYGDWTSLVSRRPECVRTPTWGVCTTNQCVDLACRNLGCKNLGCGDQGCIDLGCGEERCRGQSCSTNTCMIDVCKSEVCVADNCTADICHDNYECAVNSCRDSHSCFGEFNDCTIIFSTGDCFNHVWAPEDEPAEGQFGRSSSASRQFLAQLDTLKASWDLSGASRDEEDDDVLF